MQYEPSRMTASDVRDIRAALGRALGLPASGPKSFSQSAFGGVLGLSPANARKTIERWETDSPTGPGSVALTYLAQGALDDAMKQMVPEFVLGEPAGDGGSGHETVVRLWWPRFTAVVLPADVPLDERAEWVWIENQVERLVLVMWIDDPDLPGAPEPGTWLTRAATLVQMDTHDAFEDMASSE